MSSELVFNHHSLPFINRESAQEGILTFLKTLKECRKYGLKILLLDKDQDKSLMRVKLADNYCVSDWFNQVKRDPLKSDWARLLRSLETQQPLFAHYLLGDVCDEVDVRWTTTDCECSVLVAAYVLETFIVSFVSSETWKLPAISVWVLDMRNGDDTEFNHGIENLSDDKSLNKHRELLTNRRDLFQTSAKDIWGNRNILFPNLTLIEYYIGSTLKNWSYPLSILEKTKNALDILEKFVAKWKTGKYTAYNHNHLQELGLGWEVSGESTTVKNDPDKRKERIVCLPDGRRVFCENHIKFPHGYRLYFFPDSQEKNIYVAKIRPHLP